MSPNATVSRLEADATDLAPGRLITRHTAIALLAAAVIVGVALWRAPINWSDAWNRIRQANLALYVAALAVYQASYVVRSLRWKLLLGNAGEERPTAELLPIVVVSFFVNCVVPAKMGDVYRAYLARVRERIATSLALGTIIAERLLDLIVLMALLLIAGAIVFHDHAPDVLIPYLVAGVAVCVAGGGVIGVMRAGRGQRLLRLLPESVFHRYENFRVGAVRSFSDVPVLVGLTAAVWGMETARLALVVFALGDAGSLGAAQFVLIALVAALLTTVPFLPGGLGLVEAGMVGVLVSVGGIGRNAALSIALMDRSISYGSVVAVGALVFAVTHVRMPRARERALTSAAR